MRMWLQETVNYFLIEMRTQTDIVFLLIEIVASYNQR